MTLYHYATLNNCQKTFFNSNLSSVVYVQHVHQHKLFTQTLTEKWNNISALSLNAHFTFYSGKILQHTQINLTVNFFSSENGCVETGMCVK